MKEAKSEAERIVSSYRAEMEVNYQVSLAKVKTQLRTLITKRSTRFSVFKYIQVKGTSGTAGTELESSTNKGISDMK